MAPTEHDQVARTLANLRLQVDALETVSKAASLTEAIAAARRTVQRAAATVAAALIISSIVRACNDTRVEDLEKRVQRLEAARVISKQ
jgi:hypothetical protein